jgi:lipopolysaccharide transport system ATP-binding protein
MSSDDDREVMISVRGLGKAYTIARADQRATTLAEAAISRLRRPLHRPPQETFWALKDVSFDVRRGDVVGVIGRNGAGKSTLFKVLSRITEPTTGQVDLYGRVGSLLEVGTGFSGELTGRENIYLNGTILGMRRSEIAKRFDEIVDFSGVDKFLDTPVKRYSSGMYVRLAFAVAAHLDSDILIIDEVLAVGDAEFQKKCLGKMKDVSRNAGKTVLFVSHNLGAIQQLCDKALYLSTGRREFFGPIDQGIHAYMDASRRPTGKSTPEMRDGVLYRSPSDNLHGVLELSLLDHAGDPLTRVRTGDSFILRFTFLSPHIAVEGSLVLSINGPDGTKMTLLSTKPDNNFNVRFSEHPQAIDCVISHLPLTAGDYTIGAALAIPNVEYVWRVDDLATLEVEQRDIFGSGLAPTYSRYPVVIDHAWRSVHTSDSNSCAG